jgi:hypothetical protein
MKFQSASSTLAYSDCGRFERRTSFYENGKEFHNVWDVETGKHVAAGFNVADVTKECELYLERQQ